jgi:filamentous hemagglutinin
LRTAKGLNKYFGKDLHEREWGRVLEKLKRGKARNDSHGKIKGNGDVYDSNGKHIGNLGDYNP